MAHSITINADNVVLDNVPYPNGATVVVDDDAFAEIPQRLFDDGILTDNGDAGGGIDNAPLSSLIVATNWTLPSPPPAETIILDARTSQVNLTLPDANTGRPGDNAMYMIPFIKLGGNEVWFHAAAGQLVNGQTMIVIGSDFLLNPVFGMLANHGGTWTAVMAPTPTDVAHLANSTDLAGRPRLTNEALLMDASPVAPDPMTVTTPVPARGLMLTVKRTDAGTNALTIIPTSGTIDGQNEYSLTAQYQSVTMICDGTNWFIIGGVGI